jgi:PiT family inorganic phosphate transporter
LLVGIFACIGPVLGGTAVADTLGSFVSLGNLGETRAMHLLWCGILGAAIWNIFTWRFGLPSSSTHALVGGVTGVVVAGSGAGNVAWGVSSLAHGHLVGVTKVLASLLVSPVLGLAAGFLLQRLMLFLLRGARPSVNRPLRRGQWITAALLAFSYGTNDAQKGMGMITLMLLLGGLIPKLQVPLWVIFACAAAISLGTLLGGWRIVRTLGYGIYRLRPLHGLDAQASAAAVILGASAIGGPVSSTQIVSSAIAGTGAADRPRAVRWIKAGEILAAWLITLPGAALLAITLWWTLSLFLRMMA